MGPGAGGAAGPAHRRRCRNSGLCSHDRRLDQGGEPWLCNVRYEMLRDGLRPCNRDVD